MSPPPDALETQNFQFKNLCRLRIFNGNGSLRRNTNLLAAAPKYGLIFVGTPQGFQVLLSEKISQIQASTPKAETAEYPHRDVILELSPTHLSVSCDQTLLAVGLSKDGCPSAIIYNVASFCSKNISVVSNVRLATTPGSDILDMQFNPGIPKMLAACTSDGGLGVYEFKDSGMDVSTLPPASHATCLCWSPKGKQLVVGDKRGVLTQFKPDLKAVKNYPPPPEKPAASLVNVLWVSNFQFAAIYADSTNTDERPGLFIVNVPKAGGMSHINYEDICYSSGELRPPQFYLLHQAAWNMMFVASANSMEVGVLGMTDDQVTWQQWIQEDAARAELPFTHDKQETYPLGVVVDTSTTRQLPWGENQFLPPMPMVEILSHDGVLCVYHAINLHPGAVQICSPPQPLPDQSGLDQFVVVQAQPSQLTPQATDQRAQQAQQTLPQPAHSAQSHVPASFLGSPSQQATAGFGSFKGISGPGSVTFGTSPFSAAAPALTPAVSTPQAKPPMFSVSSGAGDGSKTPSGLSGPGLATSFGSLSATQPQSSSLSQQLSQPLSQSLSQSLSQPMSQQPKPQVSTSLLSVTPTIPTSTPAVQPIKPLPQLVPVPKVDNSSVQRQLQKTPQATSTPEASDDNVEAVDPAVFAAHIAEEVKIFEAELKKLRRCVTQELPKVGDSEEKKELLSKAESLEKFVQELRETTQGQNSEIHSLKSVLMESFAWVEDAKSRQQQLNNPKYLQLVRAQGLDPVSIRHMFNIRQLQYYVQTQLQDLDKHLDNQWGQFQDSMRPAKNQLYVPTMENVYQTMVAHNDILNKQRCIVEDITQRIALRKHRNSTRIPLISDSALARKEGARWQLRSNINDVNGNAKGENDLSKLAENLLEMKLGHKPQESGDPEMDAVIDMAKNLSLSRFRNVVATQAKLTRSKEDKLRERLSQQPTIRIKPDRTPLEMHTSGSRPVCSFGPSVLPLSASSPTKSIHKLKQELPSSTKEPASQPSASLSIPSKPSSAFSFPSQSTATSTQPLSVSAGPAPTFTFSPQSSAASVSSATSFVKVPSGKPRNTTLPTVLPAVSTVKTDPKSEPLKIISSTLPSSVTPTPQQTSKTFNVVPLSSTSSSHTTSSFTPSASIASTERQAKSPLASLDSLVNNMNEPAKAALSQSNIKPATSIFAVSSGTTAAPLKSSTAFSFASQQQAYAVSPASSAASTKSLFQFSPQSTFTATSTSAVTSVSGTSVVTTQTKSPAGFSFAPQMANPSAASTAVKAATVSSESTLAVVETTTSSLAPTTNVTSAQSTAAPSKASDSAVKKGFRIQDPAIFSSTQNPLASSPGSSTPTKSPLLSTPAPTSTLFESPPNTSVTTSAADLSSGPANLFSSLALGPGSTSKAGTQSLFETPSSAAVPSTGTGSASSAAPQTSSSDFVPKSIFGAPASSGFSFSSSPSLFGPKATTVAPTGTSASSFNFQPASSVTTAPSTTSTSSASFSFAPVAIASQPVSSTTATTVKPTTTSLFSQPPVGTATTVSGGSIFGGSSVAGPIFGQPASSAASTTASSSFTFAPQSSSTSSTTAQSTSFTFAPQPSVAGTTTAPGTSFTFAPQSSSTASTAAANTSFTFAPQSSLTVSSTAPSTSFSFAPQSSSTASTTAPSTSFSFAPQSSSTASTTAPSTSFTFALPASTTASTGTTTSQSLFGALSFGQPTTAAPATTASTSFFGQPICSPSSFGQSGNVFGGGNSTTATSTTPSIFGQSASVGAFGSKPTFGQSGGSLFGQSSGSSGFGSPGGSSIFGGASSASTNVFGGGSASPSTGNMFQQAATSSSSIFGGTPSSPSSGPFSGGGIGGTTSQSGFGSPPSFQSRPGGFGGAPAFQSPTSPAFGSAPAFGGSPTFGGAPAFGSPPKVFGSASPSAFGSAISSQQSSTFAALATQDSGMTFGNLAQTGQQPQSPQQAPGSLFGGSPAFQGPSGGGGGSGSSFGSSSSFSTWRK